MTLIFKAPLLARLATIAFLAALLLIPIAQIRDKISERQATRADVIRELASTGVGAQQVVGPVIYQSCTERWMEDVIDAAGMRRRETRARDCSRIVIPETLAVDGTVSVDERHRGIYSARFYNASLNINGNFDASPAPEPAREGAIRTWGNPALQVLITDVRGVANRVTLRWSDQDIAFAPGSSDAAIAGIHADVGRSGAPLSGRNAFSFHLDLTGLEQLSFVPSAGDMLVTLNAPWPHPHFYGRHLPEKRTIDDTSFRAVWHVPSLASSAPGALTSCANVKCPSIDDKAFGVSLIDPVDVYLESSRAVSYAFMFVGLTFATFLLLEVLGKVSLHPAQYTLIGLALTMFFLLLFSIAEHASFAVAYAIAASVCTSLLAIYTAHVLGSRLRGAAFGATIAVLYGALYLLLRSEDYALLLGSCLVFSALAAVMLLTRKLDWNDVASLLARKRPPTMAAP